MLINITQVHEVILNPFRNYNKIEGNIFEQSKIFSFIFEKTIQTVVDKELNHIGQFLLHLYSFCRYKSDFLSCFC